jgi:putative PIN family toxin of toxin-antitoxin system
MKVALDTNILISGRGAPARLLDAWRRRRYEVIVSGEQLEELSLVSRRPVMRAYVTPARMGRFINDLRSLAMVVGKLPRIDRSEDTADNFLLAMAEVSSADYLVSGDRRGVLALQTYGQTKIVTAAAFASVLGV